MGNSFNNYPFSFYRLLGFILNFYGGTYHPEKGILQSILILASNKKEETKVLYLKEICCLFFSETGLDNDLNIIIEKDHEEQTVNYILSSFNICNYLSQVGYNDIFFQLEQSVLEFKSITLRQRVEFLVGSYASHGILENTGEWKFYNNYQKMMLVHCFIINLADEGCFINVVSCLGTPHVHTISMDINDDLWKKIEQELMNMKPDKTIF